MQAKEFFSRNGVSFTEKSIEDEENRQELVEKHKRMAVPTIVIGERVFLGFSANREEIEELMGLR